MYWRCNTTSSPQFEAVLQKEGITLRELMDEEDVIQECKLQNKKLIEFLCQRNVLEELVTLITEEPSENLDERTRFKYPNIACELLTCDVPSLNESLSQDIGLLEKLYSFMDKEPPLNPLLASFLSRTLSILIVKRLDQQWISYQVTCLQAMGFLKDKDNFVNLLLKHLGTSAIMDLTLKLITEVGDDQHRQDLLKWLDNQGLVQSLVALFDPKIDSERHHNTSQLLCDVLRISRETFGDKRGEQAEEDPILARLESSETVSLLLNYMLSGEEKSESSIVGGIQVLLTLLGHKNSFNENNVPFNNGYEEGIDTERKEKVAQSTALAIIGRLKDFHQILLDPPKKASIQSTICLLDPPLGNTRLQVTKLLAALIAVGNSDLHQEIINLGIVEVLLDLFFKYVWNNFLHTQVQQCITAALNVHVKDSQENDDYIMYSYLINKCRLLGRILEAWDDNEQKEIKPKGIRQGYMGHLINIANEIVQHCEQNDALEKFITDNVSKNTLDAWRHFVENSLAETNQTQRMVLGGVHPKYLSSEDSNDDFNIPYQQQQQQMYNFQMPQMMAPELIDGFSFPGEDFGISDNIINTNRTNVSFLNENDLNTQAELFKKVCAGYMNSTEDGDDVIFEEQNADDVGKLFDDDNWDPRDIDDSNNECVTTKINDDVWSSSATEENKGLSEQTNPWANLETKNSSVTIEDGWADFSSFTSKFETTERNHHTSENYNRTITANHLEENEQNTDNEIKVITEEDQRLDNHSSITKLENVDSSTHVEESQATDSTTKIDSSDCNSVTVESV